MSQGNVEIVQRAIDAFNRRDFGVLAELSHEELEFVSVLTAVDAAGSTYRGTNAWENYFAVMDQTWDEWRVENIELFDGGDDRVACVFQLVGKGKASGVPVEQMVGLAYRIREGKLWRMRSYREPAEALEAAGLQE